MKKINLLSIAVSTGSYQRFLEVIMDAAAKKQSCYTCVANVHMLVEAHQNPEFAQVVKRANWITPDGKPLSWALNILYGIRQERVAGMDLLPDLLREAERLGTPVFFYGGAPSILEKTESFVQEKYPSLSIAGMYSPPFRSLTGAEEEDVIRMINDSGAGLVFVVLGCPKQEKWMAAMQGRIQAVMVGVGGALPVMVGMQKRAPAWMQEKGLEWLYRFGQEPKRLFKRYAVTNTVFIYLLLKARLIGKRTPQVSL